MTSLTEESLIENISKLTSDISNIKDSKESNRKSSESKYIQNELEAIDSALAQFESKIDFMIEKKITISNVETSLVYKMTSDYEKSFEKSSDIAKTFIDKGDGKVSFKYSYNTSCKKLEEELEGALIESWKKWVYNKLPKNLNPGVIDILSRVEELKKKVSSVKEGFTKIIEIADELPNKKLEEDFEEKLEEIAKVVREKWDQVGIDDEILTFLKIALDDEGEGAKYESLTPNVTEWLENNGELKNARIRLLPKKVLY